MTLRISFRPHVVVALLTVVAGLLLNTTLLAQQAPAAGQAGRGAGPAAADRSPEVMPDGTVTFRLAAPIPAPENVARLRGPITR